MKTLVQLIYASKIDPTIDYNEISKMHKNALELVGNEDCNITGMLFFGEDYFLQCIEGHADQVNQLYTHIIKDNRYAECKLLKYQEISDRTFDKLTTKLMIMTEKNSEIIKHYSNQEIFNPLHLNADSALKLLQNFKAQKNSDNSCLTF